MGAPTGMEVTFLCGCGPREIIDRENVKTMDFVTFDDEGMLICTIHGQRRKNWRSIPTHSDASNVRLKKSYFGKTPQEIEAHVVFGEPWPEQKYDWPKAGTAPFGQLDWDKRDNRDPEQVVKEMGLNPFRGRVNLVD